MHTEWTGKIIGEYRVEKILEQCGNETLLEASHLNQGRKVLLRAFSQQGKEMEKYAALVASLTHPSITPTLDMTQHDGYTVLAIEYLHGETLRQKIEERKRSIFKGKTLFPVQDVLGWIRPLAAALEYAHKKGVLHRDINASHIVVDEHERPFLARFTVLADARESCTDFSCMSGEVAENGRIDARADIYSLGCVMYELLAGRQVYEAHSAQELLACFRAGGPASPSTLAPTIPLLLEQIVLKAIAANKNKRFKSMTEFIGVLDQFASGKLQAKLDPQGRMESRSEKGRNGPIRPGKIANTMILSGIVLVMATALAVLFGKPWIEKRISAQKQQMNSFCEVQWQLGQNYQANGMKELACAAYHKIIDQYPRHELARKARKELERLDTIP